MPFWAGINQTEAQKQFEANSKKLQQLAQNATNTSNFSIAKLKPFNPNTISVDSMLAIGISQKLANQIINYRTKVGPFATKGDVAKLYNLSDSMYAVLQPFLLLPNVTSSQKPTSPKGKLEINSADSLQLLQIKGIGPVIAHRILEYRRQLGGYFSLDQLGEAFYINANTLTEKQQRMDEIKGQLKVNPSLIKKLQINKLTQKELAYHPYISAPQSKAIIQYRIKKGLIQNFEQLKLVKGFTERDVQLLQLYIGF